MVAMPIKGVRIAILRITATTIIQNNICNSNKEEY
jgi:hypothetical protein